MKIRTYSDLSKLRTFEDRYNYLKLSGKVGEETFGFDRYLNQMFYKDPEFKDARDKVIIRDNGCDLGVKGREIQGRIAVHHMNPVTKEQILNRDPMLFNPEYLICTDFERTHKAIHYGDVNLLPQEPITRMPNDTCPWKH